MSVELASCPSLTETAVRRRFDWLRLLLVVNVLAILAVAIALRGWRLGNIPGLNGDEAWSGVQAMRLIGGQSISLRTPTGNPVNPFYLGPLALLHLFLTPSITVLRIPALVSGLAVLAVNFFLCRRVFGSTVAGVSTLLLAVLPLNIAYSRFAWDASQTVLATTLVLYLGLQLVPRGDGSRRSLLPPLLVYAAAVWIHPTNVFAGWLLFVPIAQSYRSELREGLARLRTGRWAGRGGLLVALSLAGLVLLGNRLEVSTARVGRACQGRRSAAVGAVYSAPRALVFRRHDFRIHPWSRGRHDGARRSGSDVLLRRLAAGLGLLQILRDPAAVREPLLWRWGRWPWRSAFSWLPGLRLLRRTQNATARV